MKDENVGDNHFCCGSGFFPVCSSNHVIATKDGRMILTEGKPEMDDVSGLVRYRDPQGHDMQIKCNDISQIITR